MFRCSGLSVAADNILMERKSPSNGSIGQNEMSLYSGVVDLNFVTFVGKVQTMYRIFLDSCPSLELRPQSIPLGCETFYTKESVLQVKNYDFTTADDEKN